MIELWGKEVYAIIAAEICKNEYFSMPADKATNISNNAILEIIYQTVMKYLETKELPTELHQMKDLKSKIIIDKLKVSNYLLHTTTNNAKILSFY